MAEWREAPEREWRHFAKESRPAAPVAPIAQHTTHPAQRVEPQRNGLFVSRLHLLRRLLSPAMNQEIGRGNNEHGQDYGDQQTADDRARQRSVLLAAGFQSQGHGN